ncbi:MULTISPECIES: DUF4883 family protein [Clostridium]|uniref:DUF4883 family protein n=1 Tax=Clostridium cibarium TaxID=2762247 RepID=A0ABR8PP15_9CLOT|nr:MULTISPECIES: DUF4883 family protein [Clostridium]MBD7909918.1 DUF4883 family protein [Clostridium cibarium]
MKKIRLLCIFLLIFILQGCAFDDPKYIHLKEKSDIAIYTKEIYTKLLKDEHFSIEFFDTNLYKDISVPEDENQIIENFIGSLSDENYKDEELPKEKEPYQLRIKFQDSKYIIKVYNENLVAIYPWDGNYKEDILSMKDIPKHYNLYDFCKHVENRAKALK